VWCVGQTAESLNKVQATKQRAKMIKIIYSVLLLVIMVLGPLAYILTDVYQTSTATAAKRAEHVLRLENYYAEVAAEKLEQARALPCTYSFASVRTERAYSGLDSMRD